MIELAPPDAGMICAADKKNQIKNIKTIVKDYISELRQVNVLKINIKFRNINILEKKFVKKLYIILHISVGYDNIVPITANMIQEKIINVLKLMTGYEKININIFIEKP